MRKNIIIGNVIVSTINIVMFLFSFKIYKKIKEEKHKKNVYEKMKKTIIDITDDYTVIFPENAYKFIRKQGKRYLLNVEVLLESTDGDISKKLFQIEI